MPRKSPAPLLDDLLADIAMGRGLDFREHCPNAVDAAVRMRLLAAGVSDLGEYRDLLARSPDELNGLLRSLLVPASRSFRDPGLFSALGETVIPEVANRLANRSDQKEGIRAWTGGVATGESAWALAMVLADSIGVDAFDLVASGADGRALDLARTGLYSAATVADLPDPLRQRFLQKHGDGFRISAPLRERVTFVRHELAPKKPVPKEAGEDSLALVALRGALVYLDRPAQAKVLDRVAGVMAPGGALILGPGERLPGFAEKAFVPFPHVDPGLRVFARA